ncbi:antA/AntB antirepressor family protein [Klebsiella aerogenes]|nr:antA/AntB antirepressor family protein [Klebsiella aerogenes]
MKHTYELDLNKVDMDIMQCKLEMTEQEAQFLLEYRDKFKLLEGDDTALVSLKELWEVIERPYGDYDQWLNQLVRNEMDSISEEISSRIKKVSGKGRNPTLHYVTTEAAKHLAMLVRNESGRISRPYFITIEKLFKRICKYNQLRIDIHQSQKNVAHHGYKHGLGPILAKRFNYLMKQIVGKRNDLATDLEEYQLVCRSVERFLTKGKTDEQILTGHI